VVSIGTEQFPVGTIPFLLIGVKLDHGPKKNCGG